jgi:SAM-dependent methyltransferase
VRRNRLGLRPTAVMEEHCVAHTAYDSAFYGDISDEALRSARLIVPMIMELLSPLSVLDLGCGLGAWLRVFAENGVQVILGIDGDHVNRDDLLIDPLNFVSADLNKPITLERQYDLTVCIEVAEHLPESSAAPLIDLLTSAAPAVVFSAAIPGQGGTNHINEQWMNYWRELFTLRDFVMLDVFRPQIRDDIRTAFWLRQNLVLFMSNEKVKSYPSLADFISPNKNPTHANEWVQVGLYEKWLMKELGLREIFAKLPAALRRSIQRRLKVVSSASNRLFTSQKDPQRHTAGPLRLER